MNQAQGYAHVPVMLDEILGIFSLRPGQVVVDGTLGLAGHSVRFAEQIRPGGVLVGFDWDQKMLAIAKDRIAGIPDVKFHLVHNDFRSMVELLAGLSLRPDAILIDLGLNSAQIEDAERGISFLGRGPLDMRMDQSRGEPASALLNRLSPQLIEDGLTEYGGERWARAIARQIVERRKENPLRTTEDLVECVLAAIPARARDKRIHPATRTFQAIRILVNRELDGLQESLIDIAHTLNASGVLAVLSYHSGEDRIVKHAFQQLDPGIFHSLFKKPAVPTEGEIQRNPRSRSAKLRAVRRVP